VKTWISVNLTLSLYSTAQYTYTAVTVKTIIRGLKKETNLRIFDLLAASHIPIYFEPSVGVLKGK
jgi:hypothetical protein